MSKNIVLLAALFGCISLSAQHLTEDKVPLVVKDAFMQRFPAAGSPKWEKEGADTYEVEFMSGGKPTGALFSSTGQWLETETPVSVSSIPAPVKESLQEKYAGWEIEEAEEVHTPSSTQTFYELELEKGKKTIEVVYSMDGKFIREEAEDDDDDKDDDKD